MPCDYIEKTPENIKKQATALDRLRQALKSGDVRVTISNGGAVAFKGWTDNGGLADVCAYRRLQLSNSPELRAAVARAQVTSGRKVNAQAVAAGIHSHDGGATWHKGH